ncbi:MAG: chorismate-binding protein [Paracoccaceae bacterium]
MHTPYIRFDIGPSGVPEEFSGASAVLCARTPEEVPGVLRQMEEARRSGAWLAGYASYELGYALEPKLAALMPADRRMPLIQFGVFDSPVVAETLPDFDDAITTFQPRWTSQQYSDAFKMVAECIVSGDFYQANLTLPLEATVAGDILGYYAALAERQATRYGAYLDFGEGAKILSRSPELFFEIDKSGSIRTRPMKGTAPRDVDPLIDRALAEGLAVDKKTEPKI